MKQSSEKRFIVKVAYFSAKYKTFNEFLDASFNGKAKMLKRTIKEYATKKSAIKFCDQVKVSFKRNKPIIDLNKRYRFSHMFICDRTKPNPERYKKYDTYQVVWSN